MLRPHEDIHGITDRHSGSGRCRNIDTHVANRDHRDIAAPRNQPSVEDTGVTHEGRDEAIGWTAIDIVRAAIWRMRPADITAIRSDMDNASP